MHCTELHCTALHCTALHCTALHCTALHCTALQSKTMRAVQCSLTPGNRCRGNWTERRKEPALIGVQFNMPNYIPISCYCPPGQSVLLAHLTFEPNYLARPLDAGEGETPLLRRYSATHPCGNRVSGARLWQIYIRQGLGYVVGDGGHSVKVLGPLLLPFRNKQGGRRVGKGCLRTGERVVGWIFSNTFKHLVPQQMPYKVLRICHKICHKRCYIRGHSRCYKRWHKMCHKGATESDKLAKVAAIIMCSRASCYREEGEKWDKVAETGLSVQCSEVQSSLYIIHSVVEILSLLILPTTTCPCPPVITYITHIVILSLLTLLILSSCHYSQYSHCPSLITHMTHIVLLLLLTISPQLICTKLMERGNKVFLNCQLSS